MKNISIYILNVEECYVLNERLMNVFKADLAREVFVSKLLPNLVKLNADLYAIMVNIGSSALTKQLTDKDRARDMAFIGFRNYCKAFTSAPDSVQAAAAEKLIALIRKIGWSLHRQGYTEQTASAEALSEALAEPEYAKAVSVIKAEPWVKGLQETNAAFEVVVKQKNESIAYKDIQPINECKRRMVKYLKPLLRYLEIMAELEPATYTDATTKLFEEIEYVMTTAKARHTRKENQQTGADDQPVELSDSAA